MHSTKIRNVSRLKIVETNNSCVGGIISRLSRKLKKDQLLILHSYNPNIENTNANQQFNKDKANLCDHS
jgi:hypothetical protein